jgi:glycosyltransferase involved in cell wall biosynthesis
MKILIFRETELKELSPDVMNKEGLAGTENSVICLAEELSKFYTVKVCCPVPKQRYYNKVEYLKYASYAEVYLLCALYQPDILIVSGNPQILFKIQLPIKRIIFWQQNHPHELLGRFDIKNLLKNPKIEIVAPSPEAAIFYKDFYEETKIIGIYNGIRKEFFGISKNIEIGKITYVGSFTTAKGLDIVLKAAKNLPEFSFRLCGSFSLYGFIDIAYKQYCESIIKNLSNISMAGSLNAKRLAQELSTAELCIVNPIIGNKETCCVSALEAMATGTPVVAGCYTIVDNIINKGGIATPKLIDSLHDLMSPIAIGTKKKMSRSGKEFAKELSWDKIALQWKNSFERN